METKSFKVGDIVKYAEKWSREEERHFRFVVLEAFDDVQRALVECLNPGNVSYFGYTERLDYEMIEKVS